VIVDVGSVSVRGIAGRGADNRHPAFLPPHRADLRGHLSDLVALVLNVEVWTQSSLFGGCGCARQLAEVEHVEGGRRFGTGPLVEPKHGSCHIGGHVVTCAVGTVLVDLEGERRRSLQPPTGDHLRATLSYHERPASARIATEADVGRSPEW